MPSHTIAMVPMSMLSFLFYVITLFSLNYQQVPVCVGILNAHGQHQVTVPVSVLMLVCVCACTGEVTQGTRPPDGLIGSLVIWLQWTVSASDLAVIAPKPTSGTSHSPWPREGKGGVTISIMLPVTPHFLHLWIIKHNLPLCVHIHLLIILLNQLMQSAESVQRSGVDFMKFCNVDIPYFIFASFSTCNDELLSFSQKNENKLKVSHLPADMHKKKM